MNTHDVQKELIKSKTLANFSHYCYGNLYYNVVLQSGLYQFPISTVDQLKSGSDSNGLRLSEDLGTTDFSSVMKGSLLNRWVRIAIGNNQFIKLD